MYSMYGLLLYQFVTKALGCVLAVVVRVWFLDRDAESPSVGMAGG